jgi:hypothetical protein
MTAVAIASCAEMPEGFNDDTRLAAELDRFGIEASILAWDDPGADWDRFDTVVIRSTWDYAPRRDQFVAWAESIGERLHNPPEVIRWNSDKRYMGDLAEADLPVVETHFLAAGDPPPAMDGGEIVVKPTISAGARDTGRFLAGAADARALLDRIRDAGRVAMVQPYQPSVDALGETAVAIIDGEVSHTLRKGQVLRPDEVAPVREGSIGAAEAMYDPELVRSSEAGPDELELARRIVAHVESRFTIELLYARVDMVRDGDGAPVLMELEAVEPCLYLDHADGAAARLAAAIQRRLSRGIE